MRREWSWYDMIDSLKISIAIFREEVFLLFGGLLLLLLLALLEVVHTHVHLLLLLHRRLLLARHPAGGFLPLAVLVPPLLALPVSHLLLLPRPGTHLLLLPRLPRRFHLHLRRRVIGLGLVPEVAQSLADSLSLLFGIVSYVGLGLLYFSWINFCSSSTLLFGRVPVFLST